MFIAAGELGNVAASREIRVVEIVGANAEHSAGYELTLWPEKKIQDSLFDGQSAAQIEQLKSDALEELKTPPRFTYDTDALHCEKMAGLRARPANPNRKPTPKMLEYLRRFKHPDADKLTFDQAQEYLDTRFSNKPK